MPPPPTLTPTALVVFREVFRNAECSGADRGRRRAPTQTFRGVASMCWTVGAWLPVPHRATQNIHGLLASVQLCAQTEVPQAALCSALLDSWPWRAVGTLGLPVWKGCPGPGRHYPGGHNLAGHGGGPQGPGPLPPLAQAGWWLEG